MNRLEQYFTHHAELLSDEDGQATIVRIRNADCLYEYVSISGGVFRGWWPDDESDSDIHWHLEPREGWPQHLS